MRKACLVESLLDVARALAGPGYVSKRRGCVVESVDADAWVVSAGQVGVTGAETRAQNSEVFVALFFKPVEATANVDDGLATGHERAADVGADRVVGTLKLCGTANVVIRHGEPQSGDTHAIEDGAERVVAEAVRVPLGKDDDGLLGARWVLMGWGGIPAGVDQIVLRVGRAFRRGKTKELAGGQRSVRGLAADFGLLREGFRTDIGGIELGMAFFETEVGGASIAEEPITVADEELVDAHHGGFSGSGIALDSRGRDSGA